MDKRPYVGVGVAIYNEKGEIVIGQRIGSHGAGMFAEFFFVRLSICLIVVFISNSFSFGLEK